MVFRRGKHTPTTDPAPGESHCALCGQAVPVGDDGRCGLGHRAAPPRQTEAPDEDSDRDSGAFSPPPVPAETAAAPLEESAAANEDRATEADAEDDTEEEDPFASLYGFIDEEAPEGLDEAGERDER